MDLRNNGMDLYILMAYVLTNNNCTCSSSVGKVLVDSALAPPLLVCCCLIGAGTRPIWLGR
jgi:hypothetical protein